jgi:hypothetical protein
VLARLLRDIRPGETLVVVRLDRLARSVSHLLAASRRPMAPLRMSWHSCSLNCGEWRRYGPRDDMTFS